ncbi:MAG: SUMF1/EgtB/PvdO family nonheme iron enzyme [Chloracidobacterium sp.]|nr:SUMF1/EgtB/PvdO family nonheme iron enzyme [Chloracidobacterium sp.]
MNAIIDNPYRALGLFANCTQKEIERHVAKLSRYAEIGRNIEFESDLPFLGGIDRDGQKVTEAAARIEQAAKKVHWAMFWFVNVNHIDETAFGHLKEGHVEKAGDIWSLAVKDKPVTAKNLSAVLNLSTLQLGLATLNKKLDTSGLTSAIQLKGKFIASDAFDSFIELVAGKNSQNVRESARKEFVDEILQLLKPHLNKRGGVSTKQLVAAFSTFPEDIRSYLSAKFTSGPVRRIESEIAKTKESRIQDPCSADTHGLLLYEQTQDDLSALGAAVGTKDIQYQILVNKVANEILQCSIDYFNEYAPDYDLDTEDPGPVAMGLLELVRLLEPTGEVKDRLDENGQTIQEWVDEAKGREERLKVDGDLEFINNALDGFQSLTDNPTTALQLLQSCRPKLDHIAFVLGNSNELYLKISDAVVGNAMGMTISAVNVAQEGIPSANNRFNPSIVLLSNYLTEANKVMSLLTEFDMSPQLRKRCEDNGRTIIQIMGQMGLKTSTFGWRAPKPKPAARFQTTSGRTPGRPAARTQQTENMFQAPAQSGYIDTVKNAIARHPATACSLLVVIFAGTVFIASLVADSKPRSTNSNSNVVDPAKSAPPGMILVRGSTFTMGRSNGASVAESPAHSVTVKDFYIDVNEVTNEDYRKFVKAANYPPPKSWVDKYYKLGRGNYPVVGVSYADAEAYARWAGKRLPTEEEWELAARGTDGRIYPWGNDWITGKACADPKYTDFTAVGGYSSASPYGLHDVIGNAWEWTSNDFKPYPGGTIPKEFLGKTNLKTIRGGSFSTPNEYATTTYRIGWKAVGADNYDATGFRCAKDIAK